MTRLLILILCALAVSAQGATHYVRNAATGTGDGSDWVNAYIGLSVFTPVRGDTYLIADGSYSGKSFTTPVSGATYIYFKRATVASHGTSTGWNDSYASGQVVFSGSPIFDLRTSYLDFDGATGSGTSGYGILLNVSDGAPNSGGFQVYNGFTADHIRINHIEIRGTGPQTAAQSTRGFYIHGNSVNDWQVSNCYVHENLEWVHTLNLNNSTFDHCYFQNCGSSTTQHGNGFSLTGDSITFSYCTIENMLGTSNTTYFEPQGTPTSNLNIYGCVIRATSPNERTTQWSFISTASISTVTGHAYNNTIYALHGIDPGIQAAGPGFIAENNVWQGCNNPPSFAGSVTASRNILNTPPAVNFVDAPNGNFRLLSDTPITWIALAAPYNLDPDGNTRSTSVGAFQFSGSPPLPPTTPSNVTPVNGATGQSLTLTLTASAYSDPAGNPQVTSQWLVLDAGGTAVVWDSTPSAGVVNSINVPPGQLANSTTYIWKVRYESNIGLWSNYSTPTSFTTLGPLPPATPVNVSPVNGATTVILGPTLTASAYSDPQGSAQNASQWQILASDGITLVYDSGTQGAVATFPVPAATLNPSTNYKWQARYQNAFGVWSAYSAQTGFTTVIPPGTPANVSPFDGAVGVSITPTLVDSAYGDPQGSAQTGAQWIIYAANGVTQVFDSGVQAASTSFVVPGANLGYSTTYRWKARYRNAFGVFGSYSAQTGFTTTVPTIASVSSLMGGNGWYKAGSVIPLSIVWTAPVFVTGGPRLTLNNGATANYVSGSGSTVTVFNYTVLNGQDIPEIDEASTAALALNGGTIRDAMSNPANLTLPAPAAINSLAFTSNIGIDTIAPAIAIGAPTASSVTNNSITVTFPVTYADSGSGFDKTFLNNSYLSLSHTGTANAIFNANVTNPASPNQSVVLSAFSGSGNITISIAAGTGQDRAGNLTPGAGPSGVVMVTTTIKVQLNNGVIRNATF